MHVLLNITRLKLSFAGAVCAVALIGSNGSAQTVEIEGNDSVATAQVLPMGELVVTGFLGDVTEAGPIIIDINPIDLDGTVFAASYGIADGLAASTSYVVTTTEPVGGAFSELDTILAHFDSAGTSGNRLASDDDGGSGRLSSFIVPTDLSGALHVAATDLGDAATFAGSSVPGSFGLTVSEVGTVLSDDDTADYFEFTDLTPGVTYTATTASNGIGALGALDPALALFDADGNLLGRNDDGPFGDFYSQLEFTADSTGSAFFVVTDSSDRTTPISGPQYNGGYSDGGDYRLTLAVAVPEPTSVAVLGLFGLCGLARRRRN